MIYNYSRIIIINLIKSFLIKMYKLLDWIDINKINWDYLSENPNSINLLEKNIDKINWIHLSSNPNAIHLLEKNIDKIDWSWLSVNPNAIQIL